MSLRRIIPWLGVLIFLGSFLFYPLGRVFILGLDVSVLDHSTILLAWRTFLFTFYQAVLSTLLTLVLGLPTAFLFSRFDFPGKKFLRLLTAIPFMLPTVVVASGFDAWLGPRGWVNAALQTLLGLEGPPLNFTGTLSAILIAHVFYNSTIVIRVVGNALSTMDPRLEQAAASLGASPVQVQRHVLLPTLRNPILAASLLVFLFDFTSFGVILMIGGPKFSTLEIEIYHQALTFFNLPLAAWLSLIQILCTLVFSILHSRLVTRTTLQVNPRKYPIHPPDNWKQRIFVALLGMFLLVFFIFPILSLPLDSLTRLEPDRGDRSGAHFDLTLDFYSELFINRRGSIFYVPPISALLNSLAYASVTVMLTLTLGFPVAVVLARPGRLEKFLDPILLLPLGASAVTLGLGFIVAFGRLLAFPWMVPIAHSLIALPFVIRALQPSLASIPGQLRQAAATLGATPMRVWREIDWPIIRRSVVSAVVFAFTVSLGEFGATTLIYRPEYPTLPMAIYRFLSLPGGLNYGQAMAMATILMLLTGICILLIEKFRLSGAGDF